MLTSLTLGAVLDLIGKFVTAAGLVLLLFGAIGVANSIKDGQGMAMDSNVGKLVGGAFMVAAAAAFSLVANQAGVQ